MEIISILVFLGVMVLITTGKIDSTLSALIGAAVILLTKVLSFDEAIKYVDFDTIGVLVGMMLFVAVLKQSGMFEYIAIKAAKPHKYIFITNMSIMIIVNCNSLIWAEAMLPKNRPPKIVVIIKQDSSPQYKQYIFLVNPMLI